jgi:hypothetical protein
MGSPRQLRGGSPGPQSPGRLSPRTERVLALNDTYRGFLAQLDADFQTKQREWTAEKGVLEEKLTKLRSIAHMSRWLMRKVLRKMRLSHGMGLATLVFYAWGKQVARRRAARHARTATTRYYKQQCSAIVRLCFMAMQAFVNNLKVGCKLLQVHHSDKKGASPQDDTIRTQIFSLWRIAVQISSLSVTDAPERQNEDLEDEEGAARALTSLAVAPKEANSVFLRRQVVVGWRKLVHRRNSRSMFLKAQGKQAVAFNVSTRRNKEAFGDDLQGGVASAVPGPFTLLSGDYRLDLCFSHWRYNVIKSISMWRAAYRLVEFRERGLLGKTFSLWNRTVWMAQSQSYWKGELDRSINQIEEQRMAWEERVEELEAELARYMPNFGARVPVREAKNTSTWDTFLGGVESPKTKVDRGKLRKQQPASSAFGL